MQLSGHMYGGADFPAELKIGATISNAGILISGDTVVAAEVVPTASTMIDVFGLAENTATYTTTQSATMVEGVVTVGSVRPDCIYRARLSGSSTTGTDLTKLVNTSASSGGTVITDADVGTNDMTTATVWCIKGANKGLSRIITTHSSGASFTVMVPFPNAIAVGDEFLWCPYQRGGDGTSGQDAGGNITTTSDFLEADGSVASGSGGTVSIVRILKNGVGDSYVDFRSQDHVHQNATV